MDPTSPCAINLFPEYFSTRTAYEVCKRLTLCYANVVLKMQIPDSRPDSECDSTLDVWLSILDAFEGRF